MPSERARRGTRRRLSKPSSGLAEHWTTLDGVEVFYRESPGPVDAPVMLHLHGFGMSGAYLVPTAERLAEQYHTLVPDLPGFGRSGNSDQPLDVTDLAHAAATFLEDRGVDSATLVGNSMGCAVITTRSRPAPPRTTSATTPATRTARSADAGSGTGWRHVETDSRACTRRP